MVVVGTGKIVIVVLRGVYIFCVIGNPNITDNAIKDLLIGCQRLRSLTIVDNRWPKVNTSSQTFKLFAQKAIENPKIKYFLKVKYFSDVFRHQFTPSVAEIPPNLILS